MISVTNEVGQKCTPTISTSQAINVISDKCPGAKVRIHDIKMQSVAMMDVKCMQNASQSADVSAQIEQKAKQMAEAITQALSLNPAGADAENIMRMSLNVAVSVKNSIQQLIASAAASSQSITVEGACDVEIYAVDMSTYTKSLAEGVQKSEQVSKAALALQQAADQIAKAKQESLLGPLLVILIIVAIVFFGPGKAILKYAEPVLYVAVPAGTVWAGYKVYRHFYPKKASEVPPPSAFARKERCGVLTSYGPPRERYEPLPVELTYPDDPVY